jgi:hypothetical protein
MPGTENAENTLSLKVFIIDKVVASLTEISQTNFEKVCVYLPKHTHITHVKEGDILTIK